MANNMADKFKKALRGNSTGGSRFNFKSIIALLVFGAIIAVFALFGLQNQGSTVSGGAYAAVVNGQIISINDYKQQLANLERMWAPLLNMPGGAGDAQRQELRGTAMNLLISSEVVAQSAAELGVVVSDQEIRQVITQDIKEFQDNNRFSKDRYFALLEANGLNPADFEKRIRKDIQAKRAEKIIREALIASSLEKQKDQKLQQTKVNLSFVQLDRANFSKTYNPSQEVLSQKLADTAFVKEVENYFATNRAEYSQEEQIRAQHILIKSDGSPQGDAKALEKIKLAQTRLKGESFEKVAKELSEDTGSQVKGGDLGTFSRGRMVPEFENAAFTQAVGEVGQPVKTNFGYHIIKVTDKKEAKSADFEPLKVLIAKRVLGEQEFDKSIQQTEEAVKADKFDEAEQKLRALGGTWKETGFFALSEESVPKINSPLVADAVSEVSKSQPWLKRAIREGNDRYFLKLAGTKVEASTAPAASESKLASDVFRTWADKKVKSAKIDRNLSIIAQ